VGPFVTAGWENFVVAEAGASAALTGLLFVAVSINLTRILSFPHLPGRAAQAVMVVLSVLLVSTCSRPGFWAPKFLQLERSASWGCRGFRFGTAFT